METVTVTRELAAPAEEVRALIADVEPFMRAGRFDEVSVDGDEIRLANTVGMLLRIELTLAIVDREGAALAYEQRDGIFESMETVYTVTETDDGEGSRVTATTDFAVDVAFVGPVFDATVVKRQRRWELNNQLDYLEEAVG